MVSIFTNAKADFPLDGNKPELFTIEQVRDLISLRTRMSALHPSFEHLDDWPYSVKSFESMEPDRVKQLKPLLPAVLFAAKMRDRHTPEHSSGFFCVDIDYDDNADLINNMGMQVLKQYVDGSMDSAQMAFISPSRKGLKVVHRIHLHGHLSEHPGYTFRKVFNHFFSLYNMIGVNIDEKCKDWNRLCFLSYDRDLSYKDAVPESILVTAPVQLRNFEFTEDTTFYQLGGPKVKCPSCGHDKRFRAYVDGQGTAIPNTGMCDRSNSCGANIRPRDVYPDRKWRLKTRYS